MEHQEPKISAGGVNKFIPVDEMNAKYISMRAKLIADASAAPSSPARAAEPEPEAAGRGGSAARATGNGRGAAGGRRGTKPKEDAAARP